MKQPGKASDPIPPASKFGGPPLVPRGWTAFPPRRPATTAPPSASIASAPAPTRVPTPTPAPAPRQTPAPTLPSVQSFPTIQGGLLTRHMVARLLSCSIATLDRMRCCREFIDPTCWVGGSPRWSLVAIERWMARATKNPRLKGRKRR